MNCEYFLKSSQSVHRFTEDALKIFLLQNGYSNENKNINDDWFRVKYSLDEAELIATLLKNKSVDHKSKMHASKTVGNNISYEGKYISAQDLIDSNIFEYEGKVPIHKQNDENYIKHKALELFAENVENPEEEAKKIINSWNIIGNDSFKLHKLLKIAFSHLDNISDFNNVITRAGNPELVKKLNINQLYDLLKKVQSNINTNLDIYSRDIKILTDIYLEVDIPNVHKTMVVHFDKIYITPDGHINVYNFRVSSQKVNEWAEIKQTKFDFEMALSKAALMRNLGVDETKISMYDIPIILEYNESYNKIDNISAYEQNNGLISYVIRNNKDVLRQKINFVEKFLPNDVKLERISTEIKDNIDNICQLLIPSGDIESDSVKVSAETWIRENANCNGCIIPESDPNSEYAYIIDFGNGQDPIYIKDDSPILKNKEILEVVQKNEKIISDNAKVMTSQLVKEIITNIKNGTCEFNSGRGFRMNSAKLEIALAPYMKYTVEEVEDGKEGETRRVYEWTLLNQQYPDLTECNLIIFRNNITSQVDVIVPSQFHCNQYLPMRYKQKNMLGQYLMDGKSNAIDATYGNLQMFRATAIINEILPSIQGQMKFGHIKIISPHYEDSGQFRTFQYASDEFQKIITFLNRNIPDVKINNNLRNANYLDPIEGLFNLKESILSEYDNNRTLKENVKSMDETFKGLREADSVNAKLFALEELLGAIESHLGTANVSEIIQLMNNGTSAKRAYAHLFYETTQAIAYLTGQPQIEVKKINTLYRVAVPQYINPDANVRFIANLYSKALDETARIFNKMYSPTKNFILEFYQACGYSSVQASTLGNATMQFKNMYRTDEKNNRLMLFKNPYEEGNGLTPYERTFLKKALFHFAKLRAFRNGDLNFEKKYKNPNSKELQEYIQQQGIRYFWVPLQKASKSSQRQMGLSERTKHIKSEMHKLKTQKTKYLVQKVEEMEGMLDQYHSSERELGINQMSLNNTYAYTEDGNDARNRRNHLLNTKDPSFWETNVEQLLADYTERYIVTDQLNKVLLEAKCLLTQMHFLGQAEGHQAELSKSIKEVEDFLKLNVFNKSIMEDFMKVFSMTLRPARHLMSNMYIAGNIKSAFRDTFEGIWQNMARTVSKFQTDLTSKSVLLGYEEVIKNAWKSNRQINLLSEICLRYRLSNTDAARIAEKAITSRGGITNYEVWTYATLRAPDFLNRMTLFAAQCIQDGVWDAWEFDTENRLVYNWKKDKRFAVYYSGNKNHPDYAKQKGLYMSRIRMYNEEHKNEEPLSYSDDLPEPYTLSEIKKFQMFANQIYGAYDKSMKMKLEHLALGQNYLGFSTWLNAHVAFWFRSPGWYDEYFEIKQRETSDGHKYFFDESNNIVVEITKEDGTKIVVDENNNEISSQMLSPVYDKIPVRVQGMLYTLYDSFNVLVEGGAKEFKKQVWSNKYERENFRKLGWDLLFLALFGFLFNCVFGEQHKKFIKNRDSDDLLVNAFEEVLYTSASSSYEGFSSIYAISKYLLNDTTPLAANAPISLTKDLFSATFGSMEFDQLLTKNIPALRAFSKTVRYYYKSSKD